MNESQKHKRYQTSVLFAFSFLTATTYVFMRALAVSLLLARTGPDALPLALAVSAFVVIGVSALTRVAVRRLTTNRAASATYFLLGGVSLAFGYILGPLHHSLIALCALYVFAEIRGCLNTIYVVTLSNEAFAGQSSKHPYAIVASGAPVAGILVGFILGYEASVVLLLPGFIAVAMLDGLTSFAAILFPSKSLEKGQQKLFDWEDVKVVSSESKDTQLEKTQAEYRYFLAALVSIKIAVLTLVGYQWKVAAGNYFGYNETQMISYFAIFYAVSDTLIILLQWLVAGRLLDRHGIGIGLIGFPLAVSLVAVFVFFVNTPFAFLVVLTLGRGLNVLRRALHDPGLTSAYAVIDPEARPETIVFVKGMIKPFAEALASSLLLVVGGVILEYWITWIWFLLTIPWLYFAFKVSRLYQRQKTDASTEMNDSVSSDGDNSEE